MTNIDTDVVTIRQNTIGTDVVPSSYSFLIKHSKYFGIFITTKVTQSLNHFAGSTTLVSSIYKAHVDWLVELSHFFNDLALHSCSILHLNRQILYNWMKAVPDCHVSLHVTCNTSTPYSPVAQTGWHLSQSLCRLSWLFIMALTFSLTSQALFSFGTINKLRYLEALWLGVLRHWQYSERERLTVFSIRWPT